MPPYLGAELGSFLFSQSHWLLLSAASEAASRAAHWFWPLTPKSLKSFVTDVPTNPLQPTFTGRTSVLQPRCRAQVFSLVSLLHGLLSEYGEFDDVCLLYGGGT